jgi:acetyl-CoA synthetase
VGGPIEPGEFVRLGLLPGRARAVAVAVAAAFEEVGGPSTDPDVQERLWLALRRGVLDGAQPPLDFAVHRRLFELAYAGRPAGANPGPAWTPSPEAVAASNLEALRRDVGPANYRALHRWSVEKRDEFWQRMLRRLRIRFAKPPAQVRSPTSPVHRPDWLPGAELNIVDSCFQAPGAKAAILHASEADARIQRTTYAELEALTNRVANGLDALGLGERDAVALYLPMTEEAVAIYLGVIRSGRTVVGIADASAPPDLANKVRISGAKLVFTVDGYVRGGKRIPIHSKVVEAQAPRAVVLGDARELRKGDLAWRAFLSPKTSYASRPRKAGDVTNLLFSSGTTKDPKAIPWTQTTPLKAVADAHLHHDVHAEDVLAWPTSYGWMMGPWLTYATLVHGATMALFDGDARSRGFTQFIERAGVTMLGVVPKLVADWRANRRLEAADWSRIRLFSSTGETSHPDDMLWLMHVAGYKPVIEYCGGTEIGGGYITSTVVQPNAPSHFSTPALGLDFYVLDELGRPADRGEVGLVPPSIGLSNDLLNYDHFEEYFAGFPKGPRGEVLRRHGDLLERRGTYHRHLGRKKDMINVGGVKTSSEEIRNVLEAAEVEDTKPVAIDVEGNGQHRLVVYAVARDRAQVGSDALRGRLRDEFNRQIKTRLNPLLAHVEDVVLVVELPQAGPGKTRTAEWFQADYRSRMAAARPPA